MTWNYGGDPSANDRDNVRFMVGDTNSTYPQLTDEEIAAALLQQSTVELAAAICAESIAAMMARRVDTTNTASLAVMNSMLYKHYISLSNRLRSRAKKATKPIPWIGGMYKE